ncbi:hypothetical protein QMK33_11500 [Hymenobacter sp. H14-R3]|uniref:hypothetical protein n=1 Tax=Hymenobacter sp. H14-R3 TaxID=3046308 RepID=UPI0024B978FA|nr:hypothetical protein [Hymenobacter sp. H14-R3]MDJ0365779.1 hypothetical protein [Hymenobacter sp. H14-R3]
MKLKITLLASLLGFWLPLAWGQSRPPADQLGVGLLVLNEQNTSFFRKPPPLFSDSLLATRLPTLTPERTTCPTCMACAEPVAYHKGKIQPFICGSEGMEFICTKKAAGYTEISIDKLGKKAYLQPGAGIFYTWNGYMRHQASQGDYFTFVRQWDRTVLYDQPYDLRRLPRPTAALLVGLKIKNISDLKFYPVLVKGYWMKLRFTEDGNAMRYAWVVWRNEKAWLHGFQFRTD